jgi:hypothetical protein
MAFAREAKGRRMLILALAATALSIGWRLFYRILASIR